MTQRTLDHYEFNHIRTRKMPAERERKLKASKGTGDTTICNTEECTRPRVNFVGIIIFGQFHGGDDGL
jgi:hypothetical protein